MTIPIIIGIVMAVIVLPQYFIVNTTLENASTTLQGWGVILSSFALLMGLVAVTMYHVKQYVKTRYWYNALVLVSLYATIIVGLVLSPASTEYTWIMANVNLHAIMTTMAYLAFFISTAAFRAFRARNIEATILLVLAVVIMTRNMPLGNAILPASLPFGTWFNDVLTLGGNRGFTIAFGVGLILAGIKQLIGYQAYGE